MGRDRYGQVRLVIDSPPRDGALGSVTVIGHWSDGDTGLIEHLPDGLSPEEAIAWGRDRALSVLIRNERPAWPAPVGRLFQAGDFGTTSDEFEHWRDFHSKGYRPPLVLLDVDGVLNPISSSPPPGYVRYSFRGYTLTTRREHTEWLYLIGTRFELAWASTWGPTANESIGAALDIGYPLRHVEFSEGRTGETWKLGAVKEFVEDRPLVWIEDELFADAVLWAETRNEPTLLIKPSPGVGFTKEHLAQIWAFAREHGLDGGYRGDE